MSNMQPCTRPSALGKCHTQSRCRPILRAASRVQQQRPCVRVRAADPQQGSSSSSSVIAEPVPEYTAEELLGFVQQDREQAEEDLSSALREAFVTDADALFDYPVRQLYEVEGQLDDLLETRSLGPLPAGLISEVLGMGSWRLKDRVDDVISFLVGRVEGSMRELLPDDFALYPPEAWKGRGWDFCDSMDPKGEWDGFGYVDIADPAKGEEGYPRLLVENRVYSSRVFRKLHLEVAWRQDGLQVLHGVMYPRYEFDLPILAFDLVLAADTVSLAIIDPCPVSSNLRLAPHYAAVVQDLQRHFLPESLGQRSIPDWGKAIFSPLCVCIRPNTPEELAGFIKYAVALTRMHLQYSSMLQPIEPTNRENIGRLKQLLAGHKRFCEQQLSNKKTSRVLEAAFDPEWTEQYMTQLMFDYSPTYSPPWFDGSVAQLYNYFDDNPEPSVVEQAYTQRREALNYKTASEYLQRILLGDTSIKGPRMSFTFETMFNQDEEFREAVLLTLSGADKAAEEGTIGEFLSEYFMTQVLQEEQIQPAAGEKQAAAAAAAEATSADTSGSGASSSSSSKGQEQQQQPPPPASGPPPV